MYTVIIIKVYKYGHYTLRGAENVKLQIGSSSRIYYKRFTICHKGNHKACFPSYFSSIAIELNLKMTDRFTCHTDSQPTVECIYLSLLRFSGC